MKIFYASILAFLLFVLPLPVQSIESVPISIDQEIDIGVHQEKEVAKPMTEIEIDDLFGPEPYLGPTSWLDSKKTTRNNDQRKFPE